MEASAFPLFENDIQVIKSLQALLPGEININGHDCSGELSYEKGYYNFGFGLIFEDQQDDITFKFHSGQFSLLVKAMVLLRNTSANRTEKYVSRISSGQVRSFVSDGWDTIGKKHYRSYYFTEDKSLLFNTFFVQRGFPVTVADEVLKLSQIGHYLVLESAGETCEQNFSDRCYNLLVALGFVSGCFIQTEEYLFQYPVAPESGMPLLKYRKLRPGFSSIYHAITFNAYSYSHLIGRDYAMKLFHAGTLKPLDAGSIGRLADFSIQNDQIQYALVFFNEANSGELSLLVKNNCFFAILEILKKVFHDLFHDRLPRNFSSRGNIERYKLVFSMLFAINEDEIRLLEKRNVFMHGDVKGMSGQEMTEIMQRQVSLIHRILLSHVGFDGYIIDQFGIRNNTPEKAFIKLN
jgi:hypothetical protein